MAGSAEDPRRIIGEVERLKARVRADRWATSLPLFVFGVLTLLSSLVDEAGPIDVAWSYWVVAAPLGFVFIAWYERRRAVRWGVGEGPVRYGVAAIVVFIAFYLPIPPFVTEFAPLAVVGFALLVVAVLQRDVYLALSAAVLGVVGGFEVFGWASQGLSMIAEALGLPYLGRAVVDNSWVVVGLGVFLLVAAILARRREVSAA